MQLSQHFSLEEFTASATAKHQGIDNTPPAEVLEILHATAKRMEHVRLILQAPIVVSSAYRCLKLNRAVGSRDTSAHVRGEAVDFTAPKFGTPAKVAEGLAGYADELDFDQLILEYRRWVHIGWRGQNNRRQVLTIDSNGARVGVHA